MTPKNWLSGLVSWDPNPRPSGWDRLDRAQTEEDFAADARAEVTTPKGGRS